MNLAFTKSILILEETSAPWKEKKLNYLKLLILFFYETALTWAQNFIFELF